jgi:hypothetical protein
MERWVKRLYTEDALLHDATAPVQVEKDTDGIRWNASPEWEIESGYLIEDGQYWSLEGEAMNASAQGSDLSSLLNQGDFALNQTGWQYSGMPGFVRGEFFSGDQYAAMFLFLILGPYGEIRLDDDFLQDIRTAYLQSRGFALFVLNPTDLLPSGRRLGWRRAGGVSEEYPIEEKILFFRFFQESNHDQ